VPNNFFPAAYASFHERVTRWHVFCDFPASKFDSLIIGTCRYFDVLEKAPVPITHGYSESVRRIASQHPVDFIGIGAANVIALRFNAGDDFKIICYRSLYGIVPRNQPPGMVRLPRPFVCRKEITS
jgi:hypothetical protein